MDWLWTAGSGDQWQDLSTPLRGPWEDLGADQDRRAGALFGISV